MRELRKKVTISDPSRSVIEIAWFFGSNSQNGKCCENITMPEFIALEKICSTADCPIQEIGKRLGFTKSGSTRIVNRLEKKGYVQKIISSEDARICCVVITKKGEAVIKKSDAAYREKLETILAKVPDNLREHTVKILHQLAIAINR